MEKNIEEKLRNELLTDKPAVVHEHGKTYLATKKEDDSIDVKKLYDPEENNVEFFSVFYL